MTTRTWKIRDQMPDGSWGPEYTVTLEQFLAANRAKADAAKAIHAANVARVRS
jgi:hypothetical protein